jgi:hypothetical protein
MSRFLFIDETYGFLLKKTMRPVGAVALAAIAGGVVYLTGVSFMDIQFDSYQSAEKAFSLGGGVQLTYAVPEILRGTRAFFSWPESYFPNYLKRLQLIFVAGAAICCIWLPRGVWAKVGAIAILGLACFAPRVLQLLHAEGRYHNLALTGYALVIAGAVMIINRAGPTLLRNASAVLAFVLIAGYVIQCNWVSTVNHLNTVAHFHTVTQILARIRSLPDGQWDGRTIAVVGSYDMRSDYPFNPATGVATEFIDAAHMDKVARLLREEAVFVQADGDMPQILESVSARPPWPHPASVSVVGGVGVVVLSKNSTTSPATGQ